jgi:translation initiation factor IF-3
LLFISGVALGYNLCYTYARSTNCCAQEEKPIAKFYRINDRIQSQKLLVLDNEGNKLGELTKDEALKIAQDRELDLVEIAPMAKPPVAKILDFRKFLYEENKKEQAAKRNAKEVELKEIWLSPRIADHDLQTRLRRADQFMAAGDKVQLRVKFRGREMAHTQLGFELLNKIFDQFGDKIMIDRAPKLEGRSITAIIGKGKGGANAKPQESKVEEKVEEVKITNV